MLSNGMIWWNRVGVLTVGLLISFSTVACDDTATENNPPGMVDGSQLDFVPFGTNAPPLETTDTSFWAVKGEDRELRIRFQGQSGPGSGKEFFDFKVEEETLLRRPDGTLFASFDRDLGESWDCSLWGDQRFGDEQQATTVGLSLRRRF